MALREWRKGRQEREKTRKQAERRAGKRKGEGQREELEKSGAKSVALIRVGRFGACEALQR